MGVSFIGAVVIAHAHFHHACHALDVVFQAGKLIYGEA